MSTADRPSTDRPIPAFPETLNMASYFLDARIDEGRGDRTAIIDDQGSYSYAQVHDLAGRVAGALWRAGVRPEDRCLLALHDSVEFAASFFGVLKAGAVVAMVNPELPEPDYEHYLRYTRCRGLLIEAGLLARIAPQLAGCDCLRVVVVVGAGDLPALPPGVQALRFSDVRTGAARATYPTHRDDPAVWLFTSGSTGKPKAAVHFHHDFPYNTEGYAKQVLGLREDDVTLGVPKLFFGYATGVNLMFPFAAGATAVLFRERATPERLLHLIARHQATVLTAVPTLMNKMLEHDAGADLRPLRLLTSAGEALPEELYARWMAAYGVEVLDGIGSAELFHIYISNRPGEVRPGSLGRLVPGYDARVVREDGSDAGPGEIGTLWVRGDSAALCYWQDHEKSKQTLRGDWVVSGDLFQRDEEGFFYYSGRADDLLKVGGIFVSPIEVEGVLLKHGAVSEVAVVGEENEAGLVRAVAYVVLRGGAAGSDEIAAALIAHVKAQLAHYKAPSRVEFTAALPRSDRGKVLRRALRKGPSIARPTHSEGPLRLAELSFEEARQWQLVDPVVLLPVGATEAHGPHLPLGTDVFLSEELALRAQRALGERGRSALIAPSLAYAVTEFGAPFPGTVSLSPEAATALLADVCAGLHRGGFHRVCLVNSHLERAHVESLRAACAEVARRGGQKVALPDQTERRWARTLSDEYKKGNCHAGRYETALLLAARPELVRGAERLPRNDADFLAAVRTGAGTFPEAGGPRAYFGDPAAATAEEGDALYALLVQMVVTTIEETWP